MSKKVYVGLAAEKEAAKGYSKARTTRGSGCGNDPGDIVLKDYLVEHKATEKESIRLQYAWLSKITRLAGSTGKRAALQISFVTGNGKSKLAGSWVMVPASVFKELIGDD